MIAAVVLAAGLSRRMGQPKLLLPWGKTTVIGQVVETVIAARLAPVVVVAGENLARLETELKSRSGLVHEAQISLVFNPDFANGEMLASLQAGLNALPPAVEVAALVLGDQPQMEFGTLERLTDAFRRTGGPLVIPSYQMRRGHPWLIARSLWPELMALATPATLRDFIGAHRGDVVYQAVETSTILKDLDTPEDYRREKPE